MGRSAVVRHFYLLAFAISWAGLLPLVLKWPGRGWVVGLVFAAIGPALAAWIADRQSFRTALVRVSPEWLVFAAAFPIGLLWFSNQLAFMLQWGSGTVPPAVSARQFLLLAGMSLAANVWEEFGWRSCAQRHLQRIYQPWLAATVVGCLAAVWHLPLFLWPPMGMQHLPPVFWALSALGKAGILAWLFNRSRESVWAVTVCHIATNVSGAWLGVQSYASKAMVDCSVAVVLVLWTRGQLGLAQDLAREECEALPRP